MNILIIGGLMGFAVLALLGAVTLGIGDDRAEKARKAQEAAAQAQPIQPPPSQSGQLAPSTPAVSRATVQLAPSALDETLPPHPSLHRSGHLVVPNEEERLTILNGQVHEITGELRALAHQAGELELRLNTLSEVLERQPYYQTHQAHQTGPTDQFYAPRTDASSL